MLYSHPPGLPSLITASFNHHFWRFPPLTCYIFSYNCSSSLLSSLTSTTFHHQFQRLSSCLLLLTTCTVHHHNQRLFPLSKQHISRRSPLSSSLPNHVHHQPQLSELAVLSFLLSHPSISTTATVAAFASTPLAQSTSAVQLPSSLNWPTTISLDRYFRCSVHVLNVLRHLYQQSFLVFRYSVTFNRNACHYSQFSRLTDLPTHTRKHPFYPAQPTNTTYSEFSVSAPQTLTTFGLHTTAEIGAGAVFCEKLKILLVLPRQRFRQTLWTTQLTLLKKSSISPKTLHCYLTKRSCLPCKMFGIICQHCRPHQTWSIMLCKTPR